MLKGKLELNIDCNFGKDVLELNLYTTTRTKHDSQLIQIRHVLTLTQIRETLKMIGMDVYVTHVLNGALREILKKIYNYNMEHMFMIPEDPIYQKMCEIIFYGNQLDIDNLIPFYFDEESLKDVYDMLKSKLETV